MRRLCRGASGLVAIALLALVLSSCGGGGSSGGDTPVSPYWLWIVSPTDADAYQTESASVSLSGSAFVPAGAACTGIVGTLPPGYQVTAYNAANGMSAYTRFYLGCLLQVKVIWDAVSIPLVMGENPITVTATDASGNTASDTLVVTRIAETTPPTVVSTSPVAGAIDVDVKAAVTVTFSEAMDPASLTPATMTLRDNLNNVVVAALTYDAVTLQARLAPSTPLAYSKPYSATVTTGVRDLAGNTLAAPYVFGFTTAASDDSTAPVVQSVSPADGSTCAATSGAVTASFDEDLDPATVSSSTFGLNGPGSSPVPGTVSYLNRVAAFTPDADLASATAYTAALKTGLMDLAGNLAAPYSWNFTTSAAAGVGAWLPTSLSGMPSARYGHVVAWTGSEMVVAGGLAWDATLAQYVYPSQYGRYNPAMETWTVAAGGPAAMYQTAVWTGSEMIVWGGSGNSGLVSVGSRYDPQTESWSSIATAGQPTLRAFHMAVWTGSEMIVWGGNSNGAVMGDGARYDPVADTWRPMSAVGAPSPRYYHTAVWTGTEMIVWGGVDASGKFLADGARYDPASNSWTQISGVGAPSARWGHAAAWSGKKMFIWGEMNGNTNTGGLYDPLTDRWTATDVVCAPSARRPGNVIWTGSRMVIWGGAALGGASLDDGYEYDPVANVWAKITATGAPAARSDHTAVWTDSKVIYWGGWSNGTELNTGGILTP